MKNTKILAGLLATIIIATWASATFAGYGFKNNLTTEQKASLEIMTEEEKTAFFKTYREAQVAKREAREAVLDALLAGQTLTSEQEVIRAEIIKERAERKANREEIKTIMEKKEAWEELTVEEQAKLDSKRRGFKGRKRWGKWF